MATQDVTTFVQAFKDFRAQLPQRQQAMLDHPIASAQHSDATAGYGKLHPRTASGEDETNGYGRTIPRSEAAEDETAGYGRFVPRTEGGQNDDTAGYMPRIRWATADDQALSEQDDLVSEQQADQDDDMWTSLTTWLSQHDETAGYGRTIPRTGSEQNGDDTEGFGYRVP